MNKDFITAVEEIEREKGISKEILFEAIESALVSAYKKNYGTSENVLVNIDRFLPTSHVQIFAFLISLFLNICCISVTFEVLNLSMSVLHRN